MVITRENTGKNRAQKGRDAMLIKHILQEKGAVVHAVEADRTIEEAAALLTANRVGALVVLDCAGALAGVVSERDVVREIAQRGAAGLAEPVALAMTRAVITARLSETVDEALARMSDRRIRHLPVVDGDRLVGIVSIGDLVARKIEAAQAEAAAMRAYIAAAG